MNKELMIDSLVYGMSTLAELFHTQVSLTIKVSNYI